MRSERRRLPGGRTVAVAAAAALLGGGGALAAADQLDGDGDRTARPVSGIDLATADGVACGPARRSSAGSDAVLSRLFEVEDGDGRRYLLGWTLMPYTGTGSYQLGSDGNLLALQPELGGVPLGYGTGSVRVDGDDTGSVDARVDLRGGGTLRVTGGWRCRT